MKKLKKLIALIMCTTMLMSSTVFAATYKQLDSDRFYPGDEWTTEDDEEYSIPTSFTKKWSRSIQWEFKDEGGAVYNACLATVGYDTWWTNEDYIEDVCGSTGYYACGAVKNSEGTWSGDTSWGSSSKNSNKKDVKHTGSNVTYWLALGVKVN